MTGVINSFFVCSNGLVVLNKYRNM